MDKKIIQVDEKQNIVQVTIADERWYLKPQPDHEGIIEVVAVPSSTWIASYYYTSPFLVKWIADKGMSEADRIKQEAGEKGSKVHRAIDMWLNGEEIRIDTKIKTDSGEEELSPEENEAFKSFLDFYLEYKPEIIAQEYVVWGDGYAGTVDLKCKIKDQLGILDLKTSQAIYRSHELQVSSYKHADPDMDKIEKLWILQLGYRRNKAKFKLTEIDDKFNLFLNAKDTWKEENKNTVPKYIEYPLVYPTKEELDKTTSTAVQADKKNGNNKGNTKTS